MRQWKRALALGFLSWLLPFIGGFAAFPLKRVDPALFDTVMALIVVGTGALLARRYFRDCAPTVREAVMLGFLWVAINLALDYPMFSYGPMKMTAARYYAEIGAGYLLYPAFLLGTARVARTA
jgi:hypothetical protein